MKKTAMQDLREDLILTQEKVKDSLQIHDKEIREACQEVVRLTLSNIIKRIDDELLEIEKKQIIDACVYGNRQGFYDGTETIGKKYYDETFNK
jgi:hypothetical protein